MMYQAKLYEEHSAGGSTVHLQFKNEELQVYSDAHHFLFSWNYSEIIQSQSFMPPAPASFIHQKTPQYLLVIDDKHLYQEMKKHIRKRKRWRDVIKRHASIVSISAGILFSTAFLYSYGTYLLTKYLPWSVQKSMGERYLQEFTDNEPILTDPTVNQFFATIYKPLIKAAKLTKPIKVLIVKSPVKNAITLPGGYIVIFTGLIDQASNPEAIAGVLAHEIAHVKYQHNIKHMGRSLALEFILVLTIGYNQAEQGTEFLINNKFSREFEEEADSAAIEYLNQLKISTLPFAVFLQSISENDDWLSFTSTHPSTENRVNELILHDNFQQNNHLLTAETWRFIQRHLT